MKKPRKPLKRSAIRRKPGAKGLKRSWIKRESAKHREQRLRISKKTSPRELYRAAHRWCQLCRKAKTKDIHEIATRAKSDDSVESRCCWLALCRKCHDRMGDYSDFPPARQYALKRKVDPEGYDRQRLNELRGEADTAITQEEVDAWSTHH